MEITNIYQATVKTYDYDAFGRILGDSGSLGHNAFTYTGREYHENSGLYYYRARFYDPAMGRFITQDPIGHLGGINLYAYVGNGPTGWIDPLGLHTVTFDGKKLTISDDSGQQIGLYRASSGPIGRMNPKYQGCEEGGPIPEGKYFLDPKDFSKAGIGRKLLWIFWGQDWGTYRVPITPDAETNTYIKSLNRTGGFYIHGGVVEGTSGCIDVGDKDIDFYNALHDHEGVVDVTVDYSNWK